MKRVFMKMSLGMWDRPGVPADGPRKVMATKSLEWSQAEGSVGDKGNVLTAQSTISNPQT